VERARDHLRSGIFNPTLSFSTFSYHHHHHQSVVIIPRTAVDEVVLKPNFLLPISLLHPIQPSPSSRIRTPLSNYLQPASNILPIEKIRGFFESRVSRRCCLVSGRCCKALWKSACITPSRYRNRFERGRDKATRLST